MADAARHHDRIGGRLDAPVVVSPMTGAIGTIVRYGVNGIVVDAHDTRALAAPMHRTTDSEISRAFREGSGG